MDSTESLSELLRLMRSMPPGDISDTVNIEELLAIGWSELEGHRVARMRGDKLRGRMEVVKWNPPVLSFVIARHGATAFGSVYAELQPWEVDLERRTATVNLFAGKKRLVGQRNAALRVDPIAQEIAGLIKGGNPDPRLKWKSPSEVRILIGEIIPSNCPLQTLQGRRKRFKEALQKHLGEEIWALCTISNTARRLEH